MKAGRSAPATARPARRATPGTRPHEPRTSRKRPQTAPTAGSAARPARAKTTTQAKARAKARKAKAPKVIRPPLRERLRERIVTRLAGLDLRPQALIARVPFVVLVIGSLGLGLAITLWLSTDSAQRSYQLGSARELNNALTQQKEALERDVLQAESAPALADAARELGMIPSRDTAHLVLDPAGNWVVVGKPKPAEGAPPPPLNTKLPDPAPPAPPARPVQAPGSQPLPGAEVPTRVQPPGSAVSALGTPANPEVPVRVPSHAATGAALPGPAAVPGLTILPVDPMAAAPTAPVMPLAPATPLAPVMPLAPVAPLAPAAPGAGQ